jgi:CheY-like chemotaxis protein
VRALLSREPDIDVVGTASDYAELVDQAEREAPHVIVTDIRMPPGFGQEGITAANAVRRSRPEIGVVILSQYQRLDARPTIVEALVAPLAAGAELSREEQALLGLVERGQLEPALVGERLAGYRLEAILGHGGMSVVYRAEDRRLKRKVALKLIAPGLVEDAQFRARFLRESEAAASLDHPNVIPIYEAGATGGLLSGCVSRSCAAA